MIRRVFWYARAIHSGDGPRGIRLLLEIPAFVVVFFVLWLGFPATGTSAFVAIMVALPSLVAEGGARHGSWFGKAAGMPVLPTLPIRRLERVLAVTILSGLRFGLVAVIALVLGADLTDTAQHFVAALPLALVWLGVPWLSLGARGPQAALAALAPVAIFALASSVVASALAAVVCLVALHVVPEHGMTLGAKTQMTPVHRLDTVANPVPLHHAAVREAVRQAAIEGIIAGVLLMGAVVTIRRVMGFDPTGSWEEVRATMIQGLGQPYAWSGVLGLLTTAASLWCFRPALYPSRFSTGVTSGHDVGALAWLPVSRAARWYAPARSLLVGWSTFYAVTVTILMVPLGLLAPFLLAWLAPFLLASWLCGCGAVMAYLQWGALDERSASWRILGRVAVLGVIYGMTMGVGTTSLYGPLGPAWVGPAAMGCAAVLLALVALSFRAGAQRRPPAVCEKGLG